VKSFSEEESVEWTELSLRVILLEDSGALVIALVELVSSLSEEEGVVLSDKVVTVDKAELSLLESVAILVVKEVVERWLENSLERVTTGDVVRAVGALLDGTFIVEKGIEMMLEDSVGRVLAEDDVKVVGAMFDIDPLLKEASDDVSIDIMLEPMLDVVCEILVLRSTDEDVPRLLFDTLPLECNEVTMLVTETKLEMLLD